MKTNKIGWIVGGVLVAFVANAETEIAHVESVMGFNSWKNETPVIDPENVGKNLLAAKMMTEMNGLTQLYYKGRVAFVRNILW